MATRFIDSNTALPYQWRRSNFSHLLSDAPVATFLPQLLRFFRLLCCFTFTLTVYFTMAARSILTMRWKPEAFFFLNFSHWSGSVAECWTQAQKGLGSNRSRDAVG